MKLGRRLVVILALWSTSSVVLPTVAAADEWDRRTMFTFNEAVEIPGKVLPAGTYVFQMADSAVSRHVVQVLGQDGRILATLSTIPTARQIADDTRITFEGHRAGSPRPIKEWFYPGEHSGEEFIYWTHSN
jgi:hypothetical protein